VASAASRFGSLVSKNNAAPPPPSPRTSSLTLTLTLTRRSRFTTKSSKQKSTDTVPPPADEDVGLGIHMWRLACAFGLVYVVSEYAMELTICEGPSMLPTIRQRGEIVLLDRLTPRLYGLQGGPSGGERTQLARNKQKVHQAMQQSPTTTWHEPMIPVNELPSEGAWRRLWTRLTTGVSVGDVVVVQHPDRIGTVCKRVVGLPGDVVTKPSMRKQVTQRLQRRRSGLMVIPDGHIWVEGDNPWNSSDSRSYGSVPAALIVGRVLMRVWPLRGDAMMERGVRPERKDASLKFSGSLVLPAGYKDEEITQHANGLVQGSKDSAKK
jgi:signal peptidase I